MKRHYYVRQIDGQWFLKTNFHVYGMNFGAGPAAEIRARHMEEILNTTITLISQRRSVCQA